MKAAQLEARGKAIKEFILVLDSKEVEVIHSALAEYCKNNKRLKAAKKVFDDLEDCPIFI